MIRVSLALMLITSLGFAGTLPSDYESWTGTEKRDFLWYDRIVPGEYSSITRPGNIGTACSVALSMPVAMLTLFQSFDHPCDEVPKILIFDRRKVVHPIGAVLRVRYRSVGVMGQTGLLGDPDGVPGIMRLSLGEPFLPGIPFAPGLALKLFVDGRPSVNTQAIYRLDGQGDDTNFFRNDFSTAIERPKNPVLKAGGLWFSLFVKNPFRLGIRDFSNQTKAGTQVQDPTMSNYALVFRPRPAITTKYEQLLLTHGKYDDFRNQLARIGSHQILYDVYERSAAGLEIRVGEIEAESVAITSAYAEKKLFFNHKRSEF